MLLLYFVSYTYFINLDNNNDNSSNNDNFFSMFIQITHLVALRTVILPVIYDVILKLLSS